MYDKIHYKKKKKERTIVTKATERVTWCLPDTGEFNSILEVRKST